MLGAVHTDAFMTLCLIHFQSGFLIKSTQTKVLFVIVEDIPKDALLVGNFTVFEKDDYLHIGEIRRFKDSRGEGFEADTDAGVFTMKLFPSCMKAKISCNYMIEHEGKLKAVIGGSPNLLFDQHGRCRNDIVISYDDDYLVLYAIAEIFILTNNSKFLK